MATTTEDTPAAPAKKLEYVLEGDDIIRIFKGRRTHIGTYDGEIITFDSNSYGQKYREEVFTFFAEDKLPYTSLAIKGEGVDEDTRNIPPCPPYTKAEGDKDKKVVEWHFKYRPKLAIVKYGVLTNPDGSMVRDNVKRKLVSKARAIPLPGGRYEQDVDKLLPGRGKPIEYLELEDQIIATRATHMTFLPSERASVVSGEVELADAYQVPGLGGMAADDQMKDA